MVDKLPRQHVLSHLHLFLNIFPAIVLGLGTIARIKKDKISDNLLISRMYWIEALLKTNNNSSWKSILSLHGLINDELLVAMQDKGFHKISLRFINIKKYF